MTLTADDRMEIGRAAATLEECLAGMGPAYSMDDARAVVDAWARAFARGDRSAFARRLSWDGLDEAGALRALVAPAALVPPPRWTEWLNTFLAEAPRASDLPAALALCARRALGETDGITPAAVAAFERALRQDVAAELDGVEGAPAEVFRAFPVLARRLVLLVTTWVESTAELLARVRHDKDALAAAFGVPSAGDVRDASPALSDRHAGGRTVCALTFTSGLRLVYKPRDMRLERAFGDFQSWLLARGVPVPPPVRILAGEGHGWAEHVAQETVDDRGQAAEYFRRAGGFLALLHLLRAGDAHQENVVATRRGPMLVDAEMLLQPVDRREASDARADSAGLIDSGAHGVPRSCLSSGFVTLVEVGEDGVAYDVGGLMPASPRAARAANDVVLGGVVQRPESYAAEIVTGFAEAYRFFLAERETLLDDAGPLAGFAAARGRILFRPSAHYGAFLAALRAPRYRRRGVDGSVALEMLNRVFAEEVARPRLWPLVAEERRALEALDVPQYRLPTTEAAITAADGAIIRDHLVRSGLDAVRDGLRAMSEADLARQCALLASALDDDAGAAPRPARAAADGPSLCIDGAAILGDRILARGGRDSDGLDLYRGQAGIALFLAALAAVTDEPRFRDAAAAALRPLAADDARAWPSIGACSGSASVVYALATAARLLGDSSWADAAGRRAHAIDEAGITADTQLDVAGGTAGALLALLALDGPGAPAWLRERVHHGARHLLRAQLANGGWPGHDGKPRPGFAHGAAGIAYALARVHALTGDPALAEAVGRAHAYERGVFSPALGNWPAVHDGGTIAMTAWCHGAPGIGLARALLPRALRDDAVLAEIRVAAATTAAAPPGRADHLCCGVMGRADALLVMGRRLGEATSIHAAEAAATRVAGAIRADGGRSLRTEGFEHRAFPPGFFRGLAGIGYQLLRTAAPGRLPSVLGFERIPMEAP